MGSPLIKYLIQLQELEREYRMAAHLMVLKDSFQVEHHKASVSRSCCNWVEQQEFEIACKSLLSSANSKVVVKHVAFGRSLIKMKNRGPRTLP